MPFDLSAMKVVSGDHSLSEVDDTEVEYTILKPDGDHIKETEWTLPIGQIMFNRDIRLGSKDSL